MFKAWFGIKLWKRVLGALILGIVVGYLLNLSGASEGWLVETFELIGQIFVRLIRMLVVPLIFTTLVAGVIAMGDPARLGSIGVKAVGLFLFTTACAITIGLVAGTLLQPGIGVDLSGATPQTLQAQPNSAADSILSIFPSNPVASMADGQVLPIIVFSILLGAGILAAGDKGRPVAEVITSASEVVLKVALMIMELAPFGVFALIAWVTATKGVDTLTSLFTLTVTVYVGCLLHIFITQLGLVRFLANLPVITFLRGVVDPQLVAYSTSSSAATLPVTLTAAERNLGIKPAVATSVLPMGATVNMDGTALYVGIVALFAAQATGIDLAMSDYVTIALMTTLVSIGTAAVPSASLFLIAGVLGMIGIPEATIAVVVGFILPFDRILDMMRTATNVTGDLAVATVVSRWEGEFDEEVFRSKNIA